MQISEGRRLIHKWKTPNICEVEIYINIYKYKNVDILSLRQTFSSLEN